MNDLSWMLYYIDLFSNLKELSIGVIVVVGTLASGLFIVGANMAEEYNDRDRKLGLRMLWWAKRLLIPIVVAVVFAVITPGVTTLRLILASELGETVITNHEVVEVFDLLKKELRNRVNSTGE